ncbi:MAG TPA: ATP-binding protein [Candidatus Binataceae bacterium]|nr:ATP-binding protein [Candidatus Binataceae bacterium]
MPSVSKGRVKKIARSKRGARAPRELQRFESVLARAISAIARVSAHEIDREIERWQGEICRTLDLDRSSMAFTGQGVTHLWSREGVPRVKYGTATMDISPWATMKVLNGEELIWARIGDLPDEASDYKLWLRKNGPKSQVALPIRFGDSIIGGITFGKFRAARSWPPLLLQRLRLVAQVLANALERKRVENELIKARGELAAASSSTMMGELAASIAHEVNQPLGAILANAQAARRLISAPDADSEKVTAALGDIVEDARRAGEVVARVRALFKGGQIQRTALDPVALLSEAERLLRSEAGVRKISLRIDSPPSLPAVLGDRVQLLQCIMNLAINAFDSIVAAQSQQRETTLCASRDKGRWIRVSVRDTGGGIDPSISHRMFDPFVTTKSDGMGMGLLIAQSIIGGHGGKIWAATNPDVGATVSFTLPTLPANNPGQAQNP